MGAGRVFYLFVSCNQREEKFLWLFLRMVCSQDLEHLFHQQPLASFSRATRTTMPDCRNSAKQSLRLCWHCFVPSPLQGSWPCCPPPSHCAAPHVLVPPSHLLFLRPWQPGLPLLSRGTTPWGCPCLCTSKSTCEWGSKFGTGSLLGRRQALLCSPVLYQDGPTLISAGFLHSASEYCVFTHWVLCSLTCVLQSKPLLVCGSGKGAG